MANLPLAFLELLVGGILLEHGVEKARAAFAGGPGSDMSAKDMAAGLASGNLRPAGGGWPASVNPIPGASGSRLDMGFDATGKRFLSPWAGKVVYSTAHDAGWDGGGFVSVQSDAQPDKVYYLAEGIRPTVNVGDRVAAGQSIAFPVANPYNGIVGNVEIGLANPRAPFQPLAQVVGATRTQMVKDFYAFIESLGGPRATSTGLAGYP